jgi:hypothetical protein
MVQIRLLKDLVGYVYILNKVLIFYFYQTYIFKLFIGLGKVEKLRDYVANVNEYLIIKYLNGGVDHIRGPAREFLNRLEHESIKVENLLQLKSSQLIVVYSRNNNNNTVERTLIPGPTVFMLKPNEWLHNFVWHGHDPNNVGHLIPNLAKFSALTTQPDFFHYYV